MNPEFITFKKFNDPALAEALTSLLDENGIEHFTETGAFSFNPSFANNNELATEYAVKISPDDFDKANQVLNDSEAEDIKHVEKDYYLFSFTDAELMDVLAKADEWSSFDHQLSRKILTERGVEVSDATIAKLNIARIDELKVPEKPQTPWIIVGYLFALCGGILGIFIGWHIGTHKKTLPNGQQVFDYNEEDRAHGKRIFYLSIVILLICVGYKLSVALS